MPKFLRPQYLPEAALIFERFPKKRPSLPPEIEAIYTPYYQRIQGGKTLASAVSRKMESWVHKQVAKDVLHKSQIGSTLEIGAGCLNQLSFEPEIGPYDIVEPFRDLYEDSKYLHRIRNVYTDVSEVPKNHRYDRITSIQAFEHICNLPEAVARISLLLKSEGRLRVAIPSEGHLLWSLAWRLTSGLEFKIKYGFNYALFMRHEHVNTAREIEAVLRY
ncbi:MAG: class I SAM-dependent methyltransferase, partial [Bacteroidetes bacterium]|nr:class I SAM-dependent methyltransferase [Bacteroidota bacterium]